MKVGQTYKITFVSVKGSTDSKMVIRKKAELILETKYFYTFRYKSNQGDMLTVTIDKQDYKNNPEMIREV
jgi:hypothetical protein